jgi:hypothetical protein
MGLMANKEQSMQKSKSVCGITFRVLLIGLLLVSVSWFKAQANSNIEELHHKIADIALLKDQLGDRKLQTEAALEAVLKQQNELLAEAHLLVKSLNIKSFQDAQQHLRLRHDMELLGTIMSYRQAFETKIRLYQNGRDKLNYLLQLAEDDTKMVTTLSDFRIDALTTQISLVINQYLEDAHSIQINPQKIETMPAQRIWEEIANGKY